MSSRRIFIVSDAIPLKLNHGDIYKMNEKSRKGDCGNNRDAKKEGISNPTKPWSWHDRIYLQDAAQGKRVRQGMGGEISEFWIITILNMYGIQRERKPGNRNDHFCFHSVISFLMVFYSLRVDAQFRASAYLFFCFVIKRYRKCHLQCNKYFKV